MYQGLRAPSRARVVLKSGRRYAESISERLMGLCGDRKIRQFTALEISGNKP